MSCLVFAPTLDSNQLRIQLVHGHLRKLLRPPKEVAAEESDRLGTQIWPDDIERALFDGEASGSP